MKSLHPLLIRQLNKLNLQDSSLPGSLDLWQQVLSRVSTSYLEGENSRDLLDRALAISSQEMQVLNENLHRVSEERIRNEKEQTRLIVEHALDAIVSIDSKGRVTGWNPCAERIFGWTKYEAMNQPLENLIIPHEHHKHHRNGIKHFLATGEGPVFNKRLELPALYRDGRRFPVELYITPIFKDDTYTFFSFIRDITERKNAEEQARRAAEDLENKNKELSEARDRAIDAARIKSEFLANMSHEVRTPMNGILGFAEILLNSKLTNDQRDAAKTVYSSANSLLGVLNDILDFSKIEAGKLDLETIDFNLRHVIEEVLELFASQADSKGIEIVGLIDSNIPQTIHGDPGRLRQILNNLISNGVKFTEKGEVTINVRVLEFLPHNISIAFDIQDSGIGISDEVQRKLFQPFTQGDGSTTRRFGGTGLGLAICKQLVELMEGTIGLKTRPAGGSLFWFTAKFGQSHTLEKAEASPKTNLSGLHVCCVDDNTTNLRLLEQLSRDWKMRYHGVTSGPEALQTMRTAYNAHDAFDLMIIDGQMPDMDGFMLAKAIKNEPALASIPILMMTSMGQRGDGAKAKQAGIAGYMTKPVKKGQLYSCLQTILGENEGTDRQQPTPLVTIHTLKETELKEQEPILIAEDNAVNQKLAVLMLKRLGYRADLVSNGAEAVKAWKRNRYRIILMDCQMPEMDGYQATQEIRKIEGVQNTTIIIALTAHAMAGDQEKCLKAGMNDYLAKPIQLKHLARTLQKDFQEIENRSIQNSLKHQAPP